MINTRRCQHYTLVPKKSKRLHKFSQKNIHIPQRTSEKRKRKKKNKETLSFVNGTSSLREKSSYTKFFLVLIFQHLDWIWRDTEYLSVFSSNTGKYGPEKTPYLDTFPRSVCYNMKLSSWDNCRFSFSFRTNGENIVKLIQQNCSWFQHCSTKVACWNYPSWNYAFDNTMFNIMIMA